MVLTGGEPGGAARGRESVPGPERWLLIVTIVAIAGTGLFHIGGSDIWWHVRTGQWIWETGALVKDDPFSHTAEGPVRYTEALSQLFFYWVHRVTGVAGLVWSKVALLAALAWTVSRLGKSTIGPTILAVGLWAAASGFRFVVKPHLFSFLGFAVVLALAMRAEERGEMRLLWWIPPVLVVWGNLHRGGMIGLVLLACLCGAWALSAQTRRMVKGAVAVLVVGGVALTLNSAGVDYLLSAFDLSRNDVFSRYLAEWSQLTPAKLLRNFPVFAAMLGLWVAGWSVHRRKLDVLTVIVAATLLLSIRGVRFIPYCAMAMVPGLREDFEAVLVRVKERTADQIRGHLLEFLILTATVGLLVAGLASRRPAHLWGPGIDTGSIAAHHPGGLPQLPPLRL